MKLTRPSARHAVQRYAPAVSKHQQESGRAVSWHDREAARTELRHEIECLGIDVMGEIGISYGDNPYLKGNGSWQYQYMHTLVSLLVEAPQIQKNIVASAAWACLKSPNLRHRRLKWIRTFAGSNTASRQRKKFLATEAPLDLVRGIAAKEQTDAPVWQGLIDLGIAGYSSLKRREASVSAC